MADEYRLALGTISAAALNANSAYLIGNFPLQADQFSLLIHPWDCIQDEGSTYPRRGWSAMTLDEGQYIGGKIRFDWVFTYWTEGMLNYFENTYFGSAFYGGTGTVTPSPNVTVKTLLRNGVFQVYQCKMLYPNEEEFFSRGERGVERYKLRFRGGVAV